MDHYLTGTARSIPIVIVLDEDFRERGHWGPRPAALEEWAREARKTMDKGRAVSADPSLVRPGQGRVDAARGAWTS
jgi:hypothetical protein